MVSFIQVLNRLICYYKNTINYYLNLNYSHNIMLLFMRLKTCKFKLIKFKHNNYNKIIKKKLEA